MAKPIAYYDPDRQFARVVTIDDILPIAKADRLELAIIGGWQVVVAKELWKKGDTALFCEVGSLLPITIPEFYDAARDDTTDWGGETYARIKSIKLRGEISQGYLCPVPAKFKGAKPGDDLTLAAGVLRYVSNPTEAQINQSVKRTTAKEPGFIEKLIDWISGEPVTNLLPFPERGLKRSQESRIQNSLKDVAIAVDKCDSWEVSTKHDGNAMSVLFERARLSRHSGFNSGRLIMRDCEVSLEPVPIGLRKGIRLYVGGCIRAINDRFKGASKFYWPTFRTVIPVADDNYTQMLKILHDKGIQRLIDSVFSEYLECSGDFDTPEQLVRDKANMELQLKRDPEGYFNGDYQRRRAQDMGKGATGDDTFTIQGELIGPNVSAGPRLNHEQVDVPRFLLYRIFINGREQTPEVTRYLAKKLKLETVFINDTDFKLKSMYMTDEHSGRQFLDIKKLLKFAEGPLALAKGKQGNREGIVLKNNQTCVSVKVISNAFLLKNGDE